MERSLIWVDCDPTGWCCSNCGWKCSVPTLLSDKEAMAAYDRLAAAKFREHDCAAESAPAPPKQVKKRDAGPTFADRARTLISRGYKPKDAVELILQETEMEHGKDSKIMQQARADAEDFFLKIRKGLI